MSVIYWFSGTGNSLYAARGIAKALGNTALYPIGLGVPAQAVGGEGEKIGFVFPSYYGNLPRAVGSFVENMEILPDTWIFAVVTMGGLGHGSLSALETVLAKKSLKLNYGRGLLMRGNYVVMYNPADGEKYGKKISGTDKKIQKISSEIASGKNSIKSFRFIADNLYKNTESLDSAFYADDSCTGCGQCAKICPVSNIILNNKKPQWLHKCEHCVACISWCPAKAIQYGEKTKTRRRYRNPKISVNDLFIR